MRQPQGEWHCLCEQHCRNTPKSAPSSALPLTNSRTSSTTQVCSASPTLCSSVLPSFLFFCNIYGVQSTGQKINQHGMRMWPKGGGEEGWTSLEDRLDFGSPISCTGILEEELWTSHTRHPHLLLLSLCLLLPQ